MEKQLAIMCHSLGCISTQFYLLIQSMRRAEKAFREFDKWIDKLKKEGKVKIK